MIAAALLMKRHGSQPDTANVMSGDQQACFDAGMSDYIAKPIRPQNFDECVRKWTANT